MELFLGVDVGTKAIKATVLKEDGTIVESSNVPIYHLVERLEASWAQRSATQIWEHVKKALSLLHRHSEIQALCADGTSGTIVPIGSEGDPLYDFLMYSDERAVKEAQELREKSARAREFEVYLPIAPYLAIPKIMWLTGNIDFKKVYKVLHESDFISYKLTGRICTSSNVAGKSHADLRGDRYLEEIYEDVSIDVSLLPSIRPIGEAVGTVSRQASKETGLPEGIPVINGLTDGSSGDIATGTLRPGQANATIGTTLILHAVVKDPMPDLKKRFYYKTYFGNSFLAGGATNAGTLPLDAIAQLLRLSVTELDELARSIPPGCNGLIAQPQWVGTRVPETYPHARGFFAGLDEKNATAGHLFRSLLEGNALVLNSLLSIVEEVTGTHMNELRTCGGGSKSELQNQIIADAIARTVKAVQEVDPSVGSAILAASSYYKKPILQIASNVVKIRAEYHPDPSLREDYVRRGRVLEEMTRFVAGVA